VTEVTSDRIAVADMAVTINGVALTPEVYADLLGATVKDDLEGPSMFTLRLQTWDQDKLQLSWVDSALFDIGNAVVVSLGYVGTLDPVMDGEITSLELVMSDEDLPVLVVQGCDRRHRLTRGTSTCVFNDMKDSDIAAQIARAQGLVPEVVDSKTVHESVLQHAQTDLAFLHDRASAIGYEVAVAGKTLYFRPAQNAAKATLSLSTTADVVRFQPRLTARWQAGQVIVRGWDPDTKQAIVATASSTGVTSMGGMVGPAAADSAFGAATNDCVSTPVSTQQEADQLAASRMAQMALDYVEGDGECFGRSDLKPGMTVTIDGLGRRFSGSYYLVSVTHSYSAEQGYRTEFNVKRNAS